MNKKSSKIILLDPSKKISEDEIEKIAAIIAKGGVVVLPWGAPEREVFVMMTNYKNENSLERINKIKGRPPKQTLGLNALPEDIKKLADLENTEAVKNASELLKISPIKYIEKLFESGAIAIKTLAKNYLEPPLISIDDKGRKVVMFAAEYNYADDPIFYHVLKHLRDKYQTLTAGTSANRTGEGTYNISEQSLAIKDLLRDIDLFVGYTKPKFETRKLPLISKFSPIHLASSTYLDLTVDPPIYLRHGSVHFKNFKHLVPKYKLSKNIKKEKLRQNLAHTYLDPLMKKLLIKVDS